MKKIALIAFLCINQYSYAQVPSYVPTTNLEGWWSFTGNANDQSTHARHGSVTGAVLTTDRNGIANAAYEFNGLSNYISVLSTGITSITRTTVAVWAKYTGDAGGLPYDTYFQFGEYGKHSFGYGYDYSKKEINQYRTCKPSIYKFTDITNTWHHIVSVQDSLFTKIYIDGVLFDSTKATTANCYSGTNTLYFGASPLDNQYVTGSLDDIGFWTRALDKCEIEDLYNAALLDFSLQPTDKTGLIGSTISFTCNATVSSAVYQWQSNIGVGSSFVNLTNTGQYSGVTTNTLNVSSLTTTNDMQQFRCIVSNVSSTCSKGSDTAKITISNLGIQEQNLLNAVKIHPNPNKGKFNIQISNGMMNKIEIYNVLGSLIYKENNLTVNGAIDLSTQAKGLYLVKVWSEGQLIANEKILVE